MIIAIDGPAGAGKSVISERVAKALGFVRMDTGSLYRSVALCAMKAELSPSSDNLEAFVESLPLSYPPGGVCLDGQALGDELRTPEVSEAASAFSAVPQVRRALLALQRRLGAQGNAVLDGRDIGTVVFPDAELKIYLTASAHERARRRCLDLEQKGESPTFETILRSIEARDAADKGRAVAPLRQADDAVRIDSTDMTIEQVVERIAALARERRG